MSLFQAKMIRIEKLVKDGRDQYFIDYNKLKDRDAFLADVIQVFAQDKNVLAVIDTDYSYDKNNSDTANRISGLKMELDKRGIPYRVVVTEKDSDKKLFGIKLQKPEKVNVYQLGFAAATEQLKEISRIVKENIFYYMKEEIIDTGEIVNQFYQVLGKTEELNRLYTTQIYNDTYFQRIRICGGQDMGSLIEGIRGKYRG